VRTIKSKNGEIVVIPSKIVCLGRNYRKHAEELGNVVPEKPIIFIKPNSSLITEGEKIILPPQSRNVHHEVELGVVMRRGKDIPQGNAYDYVLGYCIILDITARDIQDEEKKRNAPWTFAKGFDTFAPVSLVVDRERIKNPQDLRIRLWVNGELRQDSNTGFMIFGIAEIVEYISSYMTLEEGDIIATGTPEGVGQIRSGDVVEAEIEGIDKVRFEVV